MDSEKILDIIKNNFEIGMFKYYIILSVFLYVFVIYTCQCQLRQARLGFYVACMHDRMTMLQGHHNRSNRHPSTYASMSWLGFTLRIERGVCNLSRICSGDLYMPYNQSIFILQTLFGFAYSSVLYAGRREEGVKQLVLLIFWTP